MALSVPVSWNGSYQYYQWNEKNTYLLFDHGGQSGSADLVPAVGGSGVWNASLSDRSAGEPASAGIIGTVVSETVFVGRK